MALFLALYFKLRKKKLSGMIGEGDCVFLFLLAPYFQLHNYLMFLVVSSCAALVSWLLVFRRDGSIPLISDMESLLKVVSYLQKGQILKAGVFLPILKQQNILDIW